MGIRVDFLESALLCSVFGWPLRIPMHLSANSCIRVAYKISHSWIRTQEDVQSPMQGHLVVQLWVTIQLECDPQWYILQGDGWGVRKEGGSDTCVHCLAGHFLRQVP